MIALTFSPGIRLRRRDCGFNKIQSIFKKLCSIGYPEKAKRVSHEIQTEPVLGADRSQVRGPFSDPEILASSRVDRGRSARPASCK